MKIDMTNIISTPNAEQNFSVEIEQTSFDLYGKAVPICKKQPFNLCLTNEKNEQLTVFGETSLELVIPCDRCLEDVTVPISITVERRFSLKDGAVVSEENGDYPFIEEQQLDVDRLIYDEILVNWPTKVLCRDDCKGICPVCGQNLNDGTCDCDSRVMDPRMARFQDIFQKFKEV